MTQHDALRKDGWFHEHEHTDEFHDTTYFCDEPIVKVHATGSVLKQEGSRVTTHSAGPFFAVIEDGSVQRAREEMYDDFDEQNTHTDIVDRLFAYALGDAGGAGNEDPGTEIADK